MDAGNCLFGYEYMKRKPISSFPLLYGGYRCSSDLISSCTNFSSHYVENSRKAVAHAC